MKKGEKERKLRDIRNFFNELASSHFPYLKSEEKFTVSFFNTDSSKKKFKWEVENSRGNIILESDKKYKSRYDAIIDFIEMYGEVEGINPEFYKGKNF